MYNKERKKKIIKFLKKLKIPYKNIELFHRSFIHSSYTHKNKEYSSNERLEFLGDSVLSLTISDFLFHQYPHCDEGKLTKVKSYIVSENVLAEISKELGFHELLVLSYGEENTGGRERKANLADLLEAFIAALYLDQGIKAAKKFIISYFKQRIEIVKETDFIADYKSEIQLLAQKKYKICPEYKVIKEEGPPHEKTFCTQLIINHKEIAQGTGSSKKRAEQKAAQVALQMINNKEIEI